MLMKTTRPLLAWLVAAMALITAGCTHKESDILETIPAESGMIARINCENLLESAGFTRDGSSWKAGKVMDDLMSGLSSKERLEIREALEATQAIDARNVYLYMYDGNMFLTCLVKHPDELAAGLEAKFGQVARSESFKVYRNNIMLRDDRLWIAENTTILTAALDAAAQSPATSSKGVMASLADDDASMSIALSSKVMFERNPYVMAMGISIDVLKDAFFSYSVKLEKNTMKTVGTTFNDKGEKLSIDEMVDPIDPSFAKFMPENPLAMIAFGKMSDELMGQILGDVPSMQRNIVEPYIKALDGTVALSVDMPDDISKIAMPSAWGFTLAVAYDENTAGEILRMAAALDGSGIAVRDMQDQLCLSFPDPAMPLVFLAYKEGYLVASTRPISASGSTKNAGELSKYYAAGTLSLPADGNFGRTVKLPFGLTGHMECNARDMNSVCEFPGSTYNFIESIVALVNDRALQRRVVEAVAGSAHDDDTDYTEWD